MTPLTLRRIEKGETQGIDFDTLAALCNGGVIRSAYRRMIEPYQPDERHNAVAVRRTCFWRRKAENDLRIMAREAAPSILVERSLRAPLTWNLLPSVPRLSLALASDVAPQRT
ncbi:hypothetical protein K2Z83_18610 [Oscillochloris sp. ZM17-4]|nr:hypothetical protein [Oscillochloris sp. ZM17-4]